MSHRRLDPNKSRINRRQISKQVRTILAAMLLSGSALTPGMVAWANAPTAGTVIRNQATGSFVDPTDSSTQTIQSNEVQVTVAEVAGITVTASGVTDDGEVNPDDIIFFDFTLTNVGNDPTQFFIPGAPSSITNGSFNAGTNPIQIIAYDPDGTGTEATEQTVSINVPASGIFTGNASALNLPNGALPPGGTVTVRVPITVDSNAAEGNTVDVTLGDTTPSNAQNQDYVASTLPNPPTGGFDVYTQDNQDGDAVNSGFTAATETESAGAPINGVREASASLSSNAIVVPLVSGPSFVCDGTFFLSRGVNGADPTKLNTISRLDFSLTQIGSGATGVFYNALGFNFTDGYLYGIDPSASSHQIYRVDSTGTAVPLGVPVPDTGIDDLDVGSAFSGDIGRDGTYYVGVNTSGPIKTRQIAHIDLTTTPQPTITKSVTLTLAGGGEPRLIDFAFNPVDGRVYGYDTDLQRMVVVDLDTGIVTPFGNTQATNLGGIGAVYFDALGNFYGYRNNTGGIYRFDVGINGSGTGEATLINAPIGASGRNDGAACPYVPVMEKTVNPETTPAGETVTYTYRIVNPNIFSIPVTFSDVLGDGRTYVADSLTINSTGIPNAYADTNTLTIDTLILPAAPSTAPQQSVVTITVDVEVPETTPPTTPATPLLNQATISGLPAVFPPSVLSDYPDTGSFPDETPLQVTDPIPSDPNVLLVKRITSLNGSTDTANGDDLAVYIDQTDTVYPYDDNAITVADPVNPSDPPKDTDQWPTPLSTTLVGGIDGGNVMPNDEIEYTIYYLSSGDATAESVLFCDYVPTFTSFIANGYNGQTPQATGGIGGADLSIELFSNGTTDYHTGANDGDSATYFGPGLDPASIFPDIDCDGDGDGSNANPNGAVVVNLGDLPDATTNATGAYGYVRFRTRVK